VPHSSSVTARILGAYEVVANKQEREFVQYNKRRVYSFTSTVSKMGNSPMARKATCSLFQLTDFVVSSLI
jgi:hypothetical protein